MTQDKMRRVITACVAAGTVLLACLSAFLIYQWITIAVLDHREKTLRADIAKLEQTIEADKENLEHYESEFYLNYKYWELQMLENNK